VNGKPPVTLWQLRFTPPTTGTVNRELEIRWGWVDAKGIDGAVYPRAKYASEPAIYKVYFITERFLVGDTTRTVDFDSFLSQYLPQLEVALLGSPQFVTK
jgi:hypothetical protein